MAKRRHRLVRAITKTLWKRDQMQMRDVDRLLSPIEKKSRRRAHSRSAGRQAAQVKWDGFRSVLCPVDFSRSSALALRYGAGLAGQANAILTVLYVNDPLLIAAAAAALHDRQLVERSARELEDFVRSTLPEDL